MHTTTRTKTVAMEFKFHLPFRFERQFHQCLLATVDHWQNGERTPFYCAGLGDPHPPYRHDGLVVPVFGMNGGCHRQSLFWREGFYAIDSRGMLDLGLLGWPAL